MDCAPVQRIAGRRGSHPETRARARCLVQSHRGPRGPSAQRDCPSRHASYLDSDGRTVRCHDAAHRACSQTRSRAARGPTPREPTRTEPATWTPDPPNRIRACTLAWTSVTRAHAPGRGMSVPSILPPNRHRRASRLSASTAQHPGSCAIRVTMPIKLQVTWRPHSLRARFQTYLQR